MEDSQHTQPGGEKRVDASPGNQNNPSGGARFSWAFVVGILGIFGAILGIIGANIGALTGAFHADPHVTQDVGKIIYTWGDSLVSSFKVFFRRVPNACTGIIGKIFFVGMIVLIGLACCSEGSRADTPIDETKSMLRNFLSPHDFMSLTAAESVLSSGIILSPHVKQRLEEITGSFDPDLEWESSQLPWYSQNSSKVEAHAVTVGNDSKPGQLQWCVDSGASCHFSNNPMAFVSMKSTKVDITVAKSGTSITATGAGDSIIHLTNA